MRQGSVSLTISGVPITGTSMASSFATDAVNLISIYAYSIQVVWGGGSSPVGTFKLQGSNDAGDSGTGQGVTPPVNFTDITSSPQSISGAPGSILFDVTECSYRWVRLVYTATSGSATISDAMMNVKGI
jgi:hypothetical protein